MWTQASRAPGLAAVLIVALGAALPARAASPATSTPEIVQDRDEPARFAYQEGKNTSCQYAGGCAVLFQTVPANRRRVIDHISCEFALASSGTLTSAVLGTQDFRLARESLLVNNVVYANGSAYVTVDQQTEAFFAGGETPRLDAFASGAAITSFLCTLVGHDVAFP